MIVGCKLPSGYTIEVGTPGEPGYVYYTIPGRVGKKDGTLEIPNAVAIRWFRDWAKLRYVVDGSLYKK